MAGGRPSKYKKEYCEQLIEFMGNKTRPMPYEAFAGQVGVSREVLYDWERAHPEFLHAKKVGRALNLQAMIDIGQRGMTGNLGVKSSDSEAEFVTDENGKSKYVGGKKKNTTRHNFNAATWIFMMKNIHGWRDQQDFNEDDLVDTVEWEDDNDKKG